MPVLPRVVFDTNVLFSALRSRLGVSFRLLSMVGQSRFKLQVSAPLIAEYEDVLKRGQLTLSEAQIDDVLDHICAQSEHHRIFYLWRLVLKDPDDDFLLELAVKSQATIVTWNMADFIKASTLGVQVITPPAVVVSTGETTMSTISIRLPDSLHSMAKAMASQDHVSMNQFIASAVAEKISATATETYLKERAERATQQKFEAALAAVPAQTPDAHDVM